MLMHCDDCAAVVNAVHVGAFSRGVPVTEEQFVLAYCPRCQSPFLGQQVAFGIDDYDNTEWTEATQIFPSAEKVSELYPRGIKAAFVEALACFHGKAYTATAIMCRKAMEGLAHSHGVKERNLVDSLRKLAEQNVIEGRLLEWADALRFSGNEAAHDVGVTIAAEDARDLLGFTRALLDYVYTFRERFQAFLKRREARTSATKADDQPL